MLTWYRQATYPNDQVPSSITLIRMPYPTRSEKTTESESETLMVAEMGLIVGGLRSMVLYGSDA